MKIEKQQLEHPQLQAFLKRVPKGARLFRQGEAGKTMFVLLSGIVELSADDESDRAIVSLVQEGDFFGEQALISEGEYHRAFGARAHTDISFLEIGTYEFSVIQKKFPDLIANLLKGIFGVAASRLKRANELIHLLRYSDNSERLIHLILYLCEVAGKQTARGVEVFLSISAIEYYIEVSPTLVEEVLKTLIQQNLLTPVSKDLYLIPDPEKLRNHMPKIVRRVSAVPIV